MARYTKDGKVITYAVWDQKDYEKYENGELYSKNGVRERGKGNYYTRQPEYMQIDERKEAIKDGLVELGLQFAHSVVHDMLIPVVKIYTREKILPAIRKKKDEIMCRVSQPKVISESKTKATKIIDINDYRESA